ncbi:OB-fold nucleic acid binding domain-containing protein [Methanocella arvoryzae]|uniref:OB domain-containing protein n=1 Tax=Methanocella arvoryzae (strain DSM 22066 / NBRC 105507 / MRE50) TaxID=351160 RepID=Q0W7H1_METAR|nr:OB-fold nucleic acid binding domain-containing protein [Methanocella arvoryzae]CAJ35672.1 conserved hypothetical protein [Methanocella arvoryzae MRE50]
MELQKSELAVILLLLLSTLAVGFVYLAATPSSLIPSAKTSHDGSVTIEGTLLHKETTYTGKHVLMTVKTIDGPIAVFIPANSDCYSTASKVEPGAILLITGKEQEYNGEPEIVASAIQIKL